MATVKKPSKNMIRGSWFGNATVTLTYLANNVVGADLVKEYREALDDISHLYEDGDDLNRLIIGQAPVNYAPPKGGELVMLPMLPWQAYSTIGWLTCTLPYRLVLSNE